MAKLSLFSLCLGYYFFYVLTGISVKYFTGKVEAGFVGMNDYEYLLYSTASSGLLCIGVILVLRWQRFASGLRWQQLMPIFLSGICTAFIIPSTTLLYSQPMSVMIAMVLMRAGVLIVSRMVDQILFWQRLNRRKVLWEENLAVVFALGALSLQAAISLIYEDSQKHFAFLESPFVVGILSFYLLSYFFRIYIMNYFKSVDPHGSKINNQGFFALEQLAASGTMIFVALVTLLLWKNGVWTAPAAEKFSLALFEPHAQWVLGSLSGTFYGMVAFFSVFIFLVRGRSATFAGLANRLTSLLAGTSATLLGCWLFGSPLPSLVDWLSFSLILFAVFLLAKSEKRQRLQSVAEGRNKP